MPRPAAVLLAAVLLGAGCSDPPEPAQLAERLSEGYACGDLWIRAFDRDRRQGLSVLASGWIADGSPDAPVDLADPGDRSISVSFQRGEALVPADRACGQSFDDIPFRRIDGGWHAASGRLRLVEADGAVTITLENVAFEGDTMSEWGARQEDPWTLPALELAPIPLP